MEKRHSWLEGKNTILAARLEPCFSTAACGVCARCDSAGLPCEAGPGRAERRALRSGGNLLLVVPRFCQGGREIGRARLDFDRDFNNDFRSRPTSAVSPGPPSRRPFEEPVRGSFGRPHARTGHGPGDAEADKPNPARRRSLRSRPGRERRGSVWHGGRGNDEGRCFHSGSSEPGRRPPHKPVEEARAVAIGIGTKVPFKTPESAIESSDWSGATKPGSWSTARRRGRRSIRARRSTERQAARRHRASSGTRALHRPFPFGLRRARAPPRAPPRFALESLEWRVRAGRWLAPRPALRSAQTTSRRGWAAAAALVAGAAAWRGVAADTARAPRRQSSLAVARGRAAVRRRAKRHHASPEPQPSGCLAAAGAGAWTKSSGAAALASGVSALAACRSMACAATLLRRINGRNQ